MLRHAARLSVVLLILLLLPSAAFAQAAITGVVKDTSGAILPGVTVEAASPVLIEKVRSVTTDGTGQYRIVDLRPGTYSVTFTLPGFSTVRREGIELSGSFVATVNGDLKVGALEETITVTGETPIVDVQSSKQQQTISKDIIAAIPSSRMASSIQALIPGMSLATDVGGSGGNFSGTAGNIHGGRGSDSRSLNDGLDTAFNLTSGGMFMANVGGSQEVVISTSGGLGEAETAGAVINVIPRDGANTFSGSVFGAYANSSMQSSNYTQALKDQGLTTPPNEILHNYDFNPMGGGRILRDRLWFYLTSRRIVADNTVTGMYYNKNANDITKWTYEPDLSKQAFFDQMQASGTARLTWQTTPRNKINLYWDEQIKCFGCDGGGSATTSPEAQSKQWNHPSHVQQVTWSSPVTSRVLLEAGFGTYMLTYRSSQPRKGFDQRLFQATEQAGSIPGLNFRAPANYSHAQTNTRSWRASLSYVTGAHGMKFGYFGGASSPKNITYWFTDPVFSNYRFSSGVVNRFTMQGANPSVNARNLLPNSFYAQDQWTLGKLTLQGGVRYDHMTTSYPELWAGGNQLIPVPIVYPSRSVKGVKWDDITPRMGAAYDVFGNGKTALKVTLGKYTVAGVVGTGDPNPFGRLALSTTRSWTDSNKNLVPDCVLTNPAKNGECGVMANTSFGKKEFSTTFDPESITGWGTRQYNWEFSTSVQREVLPRVSVNVGYFRRWFGNFSVTDNRATGPKDYDPFSLPLAPDSRLPDGGGTTITDLYDLNPAKFGLVDNYVTPASKFGKQIEHWDGVDVNVNARLRSVTVQGGTSTGRLLTDNCDVLPKVDNPSRRFCRVALPFQTQVKGFASYTIPRADVQVSATLQSGPGLQLTATYNVPNAVVSGSLGRSLSGGANTPVELIAPGALFSERLNQVDFRVAKVLRSGRTRTQVTFDLYNATNSSVPRGYNTTYVPNGAWLTPTDILTGRFAKVSASIDF